MQRRYFFFFYQRLIAIVPKWKQIFNGLKPQQKPLGNTYFNFFFTFARSLFLYLLIQFQSFEFCVCLHLSAWWTGTLFPSSSGQTGGGGGGRERTRRHQWSISTRLQLPLQDFCERRAGIISCEEINAVIHELFACECGAWMKQRRESSRRLRAAWWAASSMGCRSIKWLSSADVCGGGGSVTASHTDHTHLFSN